MSLLTSWGYEEGNGEIISQYYQLEKNVSNFLESAPLRRQFSGEGNKISTPSQQTKSIRLSSRK